jgi:acyl-coenzyme A thioesterase PaaI-like protein
MTLADHTCGGAAASTVPEDREVITVENKVSFLRPASGSGLICRAEVLHVGKNLIYRCFKRALGVTPGKYAASRPMLLASERT